MVQKARGALKRVFVRKGIWRAISPDGGGVGQEVRLDKREGEDSRTLERHGACFNKAFSKQRSSERLEKARTWHQRVKGPDKFDQRTGKVH